MHSLFCNLSLENFSWGPDSTAIQSTFLSSRKRRSRLNLRVSAPSGFSRLLAAELAWTKNGHSMIMCTQRVYHAATFSFSLSLLLSLSVSLLLSPCCALSFLSFSPATFCKRAEKVCMFWTGEKQAHKQIRGFLLFLAGGSAKELALASQES